MQLLVGLEFLVALGRKVLPTQFCSLMPKGYTTYFALDMSLILEHMSEIQELLEGFKREQ